MKKKFVNGFACWAETYFEAVCAIHSELLKDNFGSEIVKEWHEQQGHLGMCQLAEKLADEFELLNKGREWDGEFYEEIELFLKKKLDSVE